MGLEPGANLLFTAHAAWAMWPIGIFVRLALMVPVVTLLVLDQIPQRRGMASMLQAFVGSTANGLVAGVVARYHALHRAAASGVAGQADDGRACCRGSICTTAGLEIGARGVYRGAPAGFRAANKTMSS